LQPTALAFFDAKDKRKANARRTWIGSICLTGTSSSFVPVTIAQDFERLIHDRSMETLWRECDIYGSHGDCSIKSNPIIDPAAIVA